MMFAAGMMLYAASFKQTTVTLTPDSISIIFAAIMFVFGALRLFEAADRASGKRSKAMLLARCLCASCGAPIDAIQPASDGCIDCPDCGAAWKPSAPNYAIDPLPDKEKTLLTQKQRLTDL